MPQYTTYKLRADVLRKQCASLSEEQKNNAMLALAENIESGYIKEDFVPELYAVIYQNFQQNTQEVKNANASDKISLWLGSFALIIGSWMTYKYGLGWLTGWCLIVGAGLLIFGRDPSNPLSIDMPQEKYDEQLRSLNALVGQEDIIKPEPKPKPYLPAFDVPPQE